MRPYLVFVRAGLKSFHAQHIREDPDRNWDCCVSWYSAPGNDGGAERSTTGGLNKFDGLDVNLTAGINLLTGTAPDSSASLNVGITDYAIYRANDQNSTTIFQPGGTRNFAQTLFYNPGGSTPYFASNAAKALITASGVTPNYQYLGAAHS